MTQLNTTTSHHYTSVTSVVITEDITFLSEKQRWGKVNRSMEYVSIPLKTDKSTTIGRLMMTSEIIVEEFQSHTLQNIKSTIIWYFFHRSGG